MGPNNFDAFTPLESWVEKAVAPEQLIGTGTVAGDSTRKMTRPICAYPNVAQYRGTGDPLQGWMDGPERASRPSGAPVSKYCATSQDDRPVRCPWACINGIRTLVGT